MKKRAVLAAFLQAMVILHAGNLDLSVTDNVYNTSTKEYDLEINAEYNGKANGENCDFFYNVGFFSPVINSYMMRFPFDATFQFVPVDNASRTLMTGLYAFGNMHAFQEYYENNVVSPGIFIDHKEYANEHFIMKNSADCRYERYISLPDISSTKAEFSTKLMLNLPIKASIHLNGFAGYKIEGSGDNVFKWRVSPLASINLFNSLGLSLSANYSKAYGEVQDYYLDDSFTDEYFYSESGLSGKATLLMGDKARAVLAGSYSVFDYLPLYHTSAADSSMFGTTEARGDTLLEASLTLKFNAGETKPYIRYIYTNRKSTNALYTYIGNSLTFGIEF